jgi:hypothetical protein
MGGPYNKNVRREDPKKSFILNGTFHNTRPVGRPRTNWAYVVQRDALKLLVIRGWRRRAENRDEWRPRSGKGCSAIHGWMDGWMVQPVQNAVSTAIVMQGSIHLPQLHVLSLAQSAQ